MQRQNRAIWSHTYSRFLHPTLIPGKRFFFALACHYMFSRGYRLSNICSCLGIPLKFSPAVVARYLPSFTCFLALAPVSCFTVPTFAISQSEATLHAAAAPAVRVSAKTELSYRNDTKKTIIFANDK